MKKFAALLIVAMVAAPAMAADWSFYGSARMSTFYVYNDYGDSEVNGESNDWNLHGISRPTRVWAPRSRPTRSAVWLNSP